MSQQQQGSLGRRSAMAGTEAEGRRSASRNVSGGWRAAAPELAATWSPAARRRGAVLLPRTEPSPRPRPPAPPGSGLWGRVAPHPPLCLWLGAAGPGSAEDELVQRLAAVQLRQAGAVAGPEVHRPCAGHPGRGEPLGRRRHPRLRRR